MSTRGHAAQRPKVSGTLEWEVQVVVGQLVWVTGIKLRFSARAADAPNCQALSLVFEFILCCVLLRAALACSGLLMPVVSGLGVST